MTISRAAARIYANALFDTGDDSNPATRIAEDLHAVLDGLAGLEPQFQRFLEMPQLRRETKQEIINTAFGGTVSRSVVGLLHVLVDKRRESLFGAIVGEFDDLVDETEGRVKAAVTSAQRLDADVVEELRAAIEHRTHRQVVLTQRIDPEVLGGIRVSVGDEVIDGTIRRGLSDMRRTLAASQG